MPGRLRYRRAELDALIDQINATGYGLTGGVHTRIDETIARVAARVNVGNLYVNRNLVGAVVGVQPFGGDGLSGPGPKAGGPLYLLRLLARKPADAARRAVQALGVPDPETHSATGAAAPPALLALKTWAQAQGDASLVDHCDAFLARSPAGTVRLLIGPTGERNLYQVLPRRRVLCLAANAADRWTQLAAVLAVGADALWPVEAQADLSLIHISEPTRPY